MIVSKISHTVIFYDISSKVSAYKYFGLNPTLGHMSFHRQVRNKETKNAAHQLKIPVDYMHR